MRTRRAPRAKPLRAVLALAGFAVLCAGCAMPSARARVLQGTVSDAANGMPVYRARVVFRGRTTTLFTTREFRLSGLPAGEGVLTVEAEGYEPCSRSVLLKGEATHVEVALVGTEVRGLAGILFWCTWEPDALRIDIRLTDSSGVALQHFPALQFDGEARIAANIGSADSPRRGAVLFEGPVAVRLDPLASLEKLSCRIPRGSIAAPPAGLRQAMVELSLRTRQGTFRWARGDVPLEALN